ncbi:MAG: GerMN domain-containing protein [Actinomycetota bacterium]
MTAAIAAGCGVPTGDSSFDEIPPAEIPFGLNEEPTTTTTTTSTTTTLPDTPQTTALPTTTTIALSPVEVYFLSGGDLQSVQLELPRGFGATQVKDLLEAGPPVGSAGVGLDSLIEEGLIVSIDEADGIMTIDLDGDLFDDIASFDQSEAFGQIVLTMTTNVARIGLVLFTIDGEPTRVKLGNSDLSRQGEPVSYDDYRVLIAGEVDPGSTSTTIVDVTDTTVTDTTVPETTVDEGTLPDPTVATSDSDGDSDQ